MLHEIWATIGSENGGYFLTGNNANRPEYIHYSKVDGSNRYGGAYNSFPRRSMIGGQYNESASSGSRSIQGYHSTARTLLSRSI